MKPASESGGMPMTAEERLTAAAIIIRDAVEDLIREEVANRDVSHAITSSST